MPYILDDEQRGRVAKHWGGLGSPIFWAEIIRRQLSRIEDLQSAFASILESAARDGIPIPVIGGYDARVYYPPEMALESAMLVVAMYNVTRYASTSGLAAARSPAVRPASRAVRKLAPRLKDMRDLIEHADSLVQGRAETPFGVEFALDDDFRGELRLRVGADVIEMKQTAHAVLDLAIVIDQHILDALHE